MTTPDAGQRLIEDLRAALQAILVTKPAIVMDGNAKVGDDNAVGWNVHKIARRALAASRSTGAADVGEDHG